MGFLGIVMNSVNDVTQSLLGQSVAGASLDTLLTIGVGGWGVVFTS